jgi:hypothetical protein
LLLERTVLALPPVALERLVFVLVDPALREVLLPVLRLVRLFWSTLPAEREVVVEEPLERLVVAEEELPVLRLVRLF